MASDSCHAGTRAANSTGKGEWSAIGGNCLVRVRAQVMVRDDSTGGWVPMGGGGLSHVSVRKRLMPLRQAETVCNVPANGPGNYSTANYTTDYQIFGKKISDQTVVLSCSIGKDFTYNRVMPTFHHWKSGEHKFGLTFQTSSDAKIFDKAIQSVIDDLLDQPDDTCLAFVTGDANQHLALGRSVDTLTGDDDVFMALELPLDSRSSTASSDGTSSSGASSAATRPTVTGATHSMLRTSHPGGNTIGTAKYPVYGGGTCNQHRSASGPTHMPLQSCQNIHLHRINHLNPSRTLPLMVDSMGGAISKLSEMGEGKFTSSEKDLQRLTAINKDPLCSVHSSRNSQFNYGHMPLAQQHRNDYTLDGSAMHTVVSHGIGKKPAAPPFPQRSPSMLPLPVLKKRSPPMLAPPLSGCMSVSSGGTYGPRGGAAVFNVKVGRRPSPLLSATATRREPPAAGLQRCKHCLGEFSAAENTRGACPLGPDPALTAIECASCLPCVRSVLRRCCCCGSWLTASSWATGPASRSDNVSGGPFDEGCSFMAAPAATSPTSTGHQRRVGARPVLNQPVRTAVTVLGLLLPCLWLYIPLKACHRCGLACSLCGARHEA